jgi:hypothetical protein
MAWYSRAAKSVGKSALRGTGSFLSNHVLPDTLIPSWKTRKRLASATRAVGSLAKPKKQRKSPNKSSKQSKKQKPYSPQPPAQRGGLPTFNRNAWQRGDALRSSGASSPTSSRASSAPARKVQAKVKRLQSQARDILMNPRLVGQMFWDELKHDAKQKKQQLLSNLKRRR